MFFCGCTITKPEALVEAWPMLARICSRIPLLNFSVLYEPVPPHASLAMSPAVSAFRPACFTAGPFQPSLTRLICSFSWFSSSSS